MSDAPTDTRLNPPVPGQKARWLPDATGAVATVVVTCPACGNWHSFDPPDGPRAKKGGPSWTFNGDLFKPTFAPSMLVYEEVGGQRKTLCHSFVRDGRIEFLSDCAHALAGQTVDLPDVD